MSVAQRNFSELRQLHQFRKVADKHALLAGRAKFLQGLKCLQDVGQVELRNYDDLSFNEFSTVFTDLTNDLKAYKEAGEKISVIFLYGGHGIQDNLTYALCNSLDLNQICFPLEERLRGLASDESIADSTYVFSILDCSRERLTIGDIVNKMTGEITVDHRGIGNAEYSTKDDTSGSIVIVYTCMPNSSIHSDSDSDPTAVMGSFTNIWQLTDKSDNSCQLPGLLSGWKPGSSKKGEVVS